MSATHDHVTDVSTGSFIEWAMPMSFVAISSWIIWHFPAYTLTFFPWEEGSQLDQTSALFRRRDVSGLEPIYGYMDLVDLIAMIALPIAFYFGIKTVRRAGMEFEAWRPIDKAAVFIGRVTMMLVVVLVSVMIYEVFMRYVVEAPTLWTNELSLWLAGYVFLGAGLYAMQQRSHIRIFLIYDMCPRWLQRVFDCITTGLIVLFAAALVYGGYGEAFDKMWRWETLGTAFDPPLPATIKPTVLVIVSLVALQAVLNLISDWNAEPVKHSAADDIDEDEIERLRKAVGAEGVGDMDVTRGSIQDSNIKRGDV